MSPRRRSSGRHGPDGRSAVERLGELVADVSVALDKPLRVIHFRQPVIEDVEWIIGTDSPESIAVRLGYRRLDTLQTSLRKWGRADLADRLSPNGVRTAA